MEENLKQLLLKDLCARLPYGVKVNHQGFLQELTVIVLEDIIYSGHEVKPYLRSMSSMTKNERKQFCNLANCDKYELEDFITYSIFEMNVSYKVYDWLNAHHFDYRGLIMRGLAIEASKDIYNIKTE